jgi:mono/diheme cytochrome c family protein
MPHRRRAALFAGLVLLAGVPVGGAAGETAPAVEFHRDVRPILSDYCFQCHGPDAAQRKKNLRLDTEAGARTVVVAGRPEASELYLRVSAADDAHRMPPRSTGRRLTPPQVELLRRWIEQGAPWQPHWALVPPRRPALPAVRDAGWVRNGIEPSSSPASSAKAWPPRRRPTAARSCAA